MTLSVVKRLAIVNYHDIPGCLREIAGRIESGSMGAVGNVTVVVTAPGDVHPAVYGLGDFDPIKTVGVLQAAMHSILSCRQPGRDTLEKRT